MNYGEDDGGSEVELETMQARSWPTVTQYSVFLENRVGQLLEVHRSFQGTRVKIVGLTISDSADCSILRLILSHSEQGREILVLNKHAFAENELIVVELPLGPQSLSDLCMALLQAEINIHYAYPLIVHPRNRPAVALHIDNVEQASVTLHNMGFEVLCEADLRTESQGMIAAGASPVPWRSVHESPSQGDADVDRNRSRFGADRRFDRPPRRPGWSRR